MDEAYEIVRATKDDIDGVLDLQENNLPHRGGTLSVRFSREWFDKTIADMPVVVARRAGRVIGYLVSSSLAANADVAIIQAMLQTYRGASDAYVYGPICVEEAERGRGVAGRLFAALRDQLRGREGVLFIRCDNEASLRAHIRMGVRKVAEFNHNGAKLAVLSYIG